MIATALHRLVALQCASSRVTALYTRSSTTATRVLGARVIGAACPFTTHTNSDFSDLNTVIKTLREIAREHDRQSSEQSPLRLPDTKLLKVLGHHELVRAIRKHHGGFVGVAARMGIAPDSDALEIHKQKSSRANRRAKRSTRLAKHDYY